MTFENGTGNVGIGTGTPSAKLEIVNNETIKIGPAFFGGTATPSGVDIAHMNTHAWYNAWDRRRMN